MSLKETSKASIGSRPELDIPANLFELLKSDWENDGYKLAKIYFLQLKHSLMGNFPAIFSQDVSRVICTPDLQLLEKVWQTLEPRPAELVEVTAYVNNAIGYAYVETRYTSEREQRLPIKLITEEEFERLVAVKNEDEDEKPFRWAFGLIGGGRLRREHFSERLVNEAKNFNPKFNSQFI